MERSDRERRGVRSGRDISLGNLQMGGRGGGMEKKGWKEGGMGERERGGREGFRILDILELFELGFIVQV